MVRGGRVPECLVEISYLRGKKDLTTVKPLREHKDVVNCKKKSIVSTKLKRRSARKAKRREY
jgi:hypothetical protein